MSNYCDICLKHFSDGNGFQGHLKGKKHIRKFEQVDILERSIVVTQLPKFISTEVLIKFFQKYGPIKTYKFVRTCLILEFVNRSSTQILLSKPVWINNVKLNIKRKGIHNGEQKSIREDNATKNSDIICYDNIKHIFEENTTFDDQLVTFLNTVQLTNDEMKEKYEPTCTHLAQIFKVLFPMCKIYTFGSTYIGLGFKECDLDIYMNIGEPIHDETTGFAWTMTQLLRTVKKIMFKMKSTFSHVITIPTAKIPIIKFCYIPTNIQCDISFKNSLGIYKSRLIKYCLSLDSRLKPLMIFIKYWARHFKLSGTGKISNFALVLLTIFYLQQPSVDIIPPLRLMLYNNEPEFVGDWLYKIDENVVLPPITNNKSIPQLIHDFFSFYAKFDFELQVICPINGRTYTKSEFAVLDTLSVCMDTYKIQVTKNRCTKLDTTKLMCVQDPIELNANVTASASFSTAYDFAQYCAAGAEICVMSSKNEYRDLMNSLFTAVKPKNNIGSTRFKVEIKINESLQSVNKNWYSNILSILQDILEKVFLLKVEILLDETKIHPKVKKLSDVRIQMLEGVKLHCTGSHCVWRNRKVDSVIFDPALNRLQKEILISEKTIKNCDKNDDSSKKNLNFTCTFKKDDWLPIVRLTIHKNITSDSHVFQRFALFAKPKIIEIIDKTLFHMQVFNKCC